MSPLMHQLVSRTRQLLAVSGGGLNVRAPFISVRNVATFSEWATLTVAQFLQLSEAPNAH